MMLRLDKADIEVFVKKVNFGKMKGLVPVVVQDASSDKVLMQAFMNEKALRATLSSGRLHFWSRTRERIWLKGEESGHYSLLQDASLDCDYDAILFKVQQIGSICHTGKETCFHEPIVAEKERAVDAKAIERIFEVVMDRIRNPTNESYVSHLASKGEDAVLQKIGEETVELILATKHDVHRELIQEATDLFFHVLILLAQKDLELEEIFSELQHRHQAKTQFPKQPD
jgi:phosphoribosyl-ATP pyrophosphohydrolase/phosphoribosyl-AMP cyclohydrolase